MVTLNHKLISISLTLLAAGCRSSDSSASDGGMCEGTVEAVCSQKPCIMQWPQDLSTFCSVATSPDWAGIHDSCGPYRVFDNSGVDSGSMYYYDRATGQLVAIVRFINYDRKCIAGPSNFVEPQP